MTDPGPNPPVADDESPALSFKLLVTLAVAALLLGAGYLLYAGATGVGTFKKVCEASKGRPAEITLTELTAIGATAGPASENGTVTVQHKAGARCVVRITDEKVFSSLFEE